MNDTNKNDLKGYTFIRNQIIHFGITPSLREIADAVGHSSRNSAEKMLVRLENRGLIKRTKNGIRLSGQTSSITGKTVDVPLIGTIACGTPTLAEQHYEALIPVSVHLASPGHTYFLLRAKGTSMNKSGINNGDLLLIRQQPTASYDGEKVVALINDEATVKHFYHGDGFIMLKPNSTNLKHKPIILSENFIIQGVVVATLPKNLY